MGPTSKLNSQDELHSIQRYLYKHLKTISYKNNMVQSNTVKLLVAATPNSAIIFICKAYSGCIFDKALTSKSKYLDITPVFKKEDSNNVKNYRPVSVLPVMSKVFERIMEKQIAAYMEEFRKGFSTQHALIALIEKWKSSLDQKGYAGSILMDLSKAFDTIDYDLLLAKLHAYGFDKQALSLIKSY